MSTTIEQVQKDKKILQKTLCEQSTAIKQQLCKIDSLQQKIKQMQFQLNSLCKVEKSCDKKNHSGVQSTLLTIRNRINLAESHIKMEQKQQKLSKQLHVQKNRIKQLRQKQQQQLQNAKKWNKQQKQNMMKQIKQISNKNQSIIKKRKLDQLQKNKTKAQQIRKNKEQFRQAMIQSKIKQLKQKHQQELDRSQLRIQKKSELQTRLSSLEKEKYNIQKRVEQKKEYHKRLQSIYADIGKMKDDQIKNIMKQIKKKVVNHQKKSKNSTNHKDKSPYKKNQRKPTQQNPASLSTTQQSSSTTKTQPIQNDQQYMKYKMIQQYLQSQHKNRSNKVNCRFQV